MNTPVIQLPYMGKHKDVEHKPTSLVRRIEIPFTDLARYEEDQVHERLGANDDPYKTLTRKVSHLAALLHVSEAEAEHILFDRIGHAHRG